MKDNLTAYLNRCKATGQMRILILFAVLIVLSLSLYATFLSGLINSVLNREGSSHGVLVPFISLLFLWNRRREIKKLRPEFAPMQGSLMVLAGLMLYYMGRHNPAGMLTALSFFILSAGVMLLCLGSRIFQEIRFSFFFLMTMMPLPEPVYIKIAELMRSVSTAGSVWISRLCGVPLVRDGYYIYLPNTNLFVAEGCSGMRYLISYLVFSVAYAYYFKRSVKSRLLVVLAALPISIFAAVMRLTVIFLAAYYIGAFMAGKQVHILLSWFVFAALLAGAMILDYRFFRGLGDPQAGRQESPSP